MEDETILTKLITPSLYHNEMTQIQDYITQINSGNCTKDEADNLLTKIKRLQNHANTTYESLTQQKSDTWKQIKLLMNTESAIKTYLKGCVKESTL